LEEVMEEDFMGLESDEEEGGRRKSRLFVSLNREGSFGPDRGKEGGREGGREGGKEGGRIMGLVRKKSKKIKDIPIESTRREEPKKETKGNREDGR
jgi:hypothetical protein